MTAEKLIPLAPRPLSQRERVRGRETLPTNLAGRNPLVVPSQYHWIVAVRLVRASTSNGTMSSTGAGVPAPLFSV